LLEASAVERPTVHALAALFCFSTARLTTRLDDDGVTVPLADQGREVLASLTDDPKLARYSFFWAAVADVERRSGHTAEARTMYQRAVALSRSRAERLSYERRLRNLEN
jgi:predicted RNA polymerase sigma factor